MPFTRTAAPVLRRIAHPAPVQLQHRIRRRQRRGDARYLARPFDRDRLRAFDSLVWRHVKNETARTRRRKLGSPRLKPVSSTTGSVNSTVIFRSPRPRKSNAVSAAVLAGGAAFPSTRAACEMRSGISAASPSTLTAPMDAPSKKIQPHLRPLVREHRHLQRRRHLHDLSRQPRLMSSA